MDGGQQQGTAFELKKGGLKFTSSLGIDVEDKV